MCFLRYYLDKWVTHRPSDPPRRANAGGIPDQLRHSRHEKRDVVPGQAR